MRSRVSTAELIAPRRSRVSTTLEGLSFLQLPLKLCIIKRRWSALNSLQPSPRCSPLTPLATGAQAPPGARELPGSMEGLGWLAR
jgi:hypothetical protein